MGNGCFTKHQLKTQSFGVPRRSNGFLKIDVLIGIEIWGYGSRQIAPLLSFEMIFPETEHFALEQMIVGRGYIYIFFLLELNGLQYPLNNGSWKTTFL